MKNIRLVRKLVSILLLLCFFLPLSKCTTTQQVAGKAVVNESYLYGAEIVRDAVLEVEKGEVLSGSANLLAVVIVFFLPTLCLKLAVQIQAVMHVVLAFYAAYYLFMWVLVLGSTPQIGGLLAMTCWLLLFVLGVISTWEHWRGKRLAPLQS